MASGGSDLTINGCHLNEAGYKVFAETLFTKTFGGQGAGGGRAGARGGD